MGHFLLGGVKILLAVQATQATVVGKVRDEETGDPLAGAVVALTDLHRVAATDADGRFVLRQVPAGPQHVTVHLIGYAQRSLHALVPGHGQLEINVSLPRAPVRLQAIEVSASAMVRSAGGDDRIPFPDRGSSIAAVWSHPLLAEPDAFQALGGGEVVMRPESPSGIHIRGGASDQTAYLLDGIPVLSPYHAAGLFSAWNPDALSGLELWSAAPPPAYPEALSGVVEAATRSPGASHGVQGSVGTTQARLTLDGPLGVTGVGYLVSLRSGFPGVMAPKDEPSYLRGEAGDWLAKLEAPVFGGRARLLGYESANEINAAAVTEGGPGGWGRNAFAWHSQSFGAEWTGVFSHVGVRVLGWSAAGGAGSEWAAPVDRLHLASARRDDGLRLTVEHHAPRATILAGIRVERSTTSYRIESDSSVEPSWSLNARTVVPAVFAQYSRGIGDRMELTLATSLAAPGGGYDPHLSPRAQLRWHLSEQLVLSGSYARLHQFAQSLRNPESVVGNVFPVDLFMGAGAPGIPVARSDQGVIAADYRPVAGVRFGAQVYERGSSGLLLVAPRDGEPFTTGAFAVGSGVSRGASVHATVSAARYGIVASYGAQHVRLRHADSRYVPDHGATHLLEGGVIVFPTASSSIRLGVTSALGRRTTIVSGGLEWEACNLLDQGCEFVGSPHYGGEPLGTTGLPAYLRVDLGVRKHWHVAVGGRDAVVALFGTVTNVFNRKNVLTYARNPSTGQLAPIEMRPLAPLVVGLDWRF